MPWTPGLVVRVFTHERAALGRRPAVDALLALVQTERLAGVTVTRALTGSDHAHYDAGMRSSAASTSTLEGAGSSPGRSGQHSRGAPLIIEIVDRSERIEAILPKLTTLCGSGALSVTEARVYVPASHLRVRDVMAPAQVIARPEAPLAQALNALLDTNARLIPVITPEGRVVGVVTMGQLLERVDDALATHLLTMRAAAEVREHILGHIEGRSVGRYMRSPAITLREDLPLDTAARLLAKHDITRAPVVGADGRLVGILSEHALITALAAPLLTASYSPQDLSATDAELRAVLQASVEPSAGEPLTAGALSDQSIPRISITAAWPEVARTIEAISESAIARIALVIDPRGGLAGVIEEHELLRRLTQAPDEGRWLSLRRALARATGQGSALAPTAPDHAQAADLAHQARVITRPDTPLALALAEMAQADEADYAVVVADDGAPVGVLWRSVALRALIGA
jgi:CBS domain-containing protein